MEKKSPKTRKNNMTRFTILRRLPLLLSLTRRAVFFFMFVLIASVLLFFSGNVQNFLDANLNLILTICSCSAIGMAFFCLCAVFECIYYAISDKKFYFYIHMIIFILGFLLALTFCIFTQSIDVLAAGTGGH